MTPQSFAIAALDGRREQTLAEEFELHLRPENIRVLVLEDDRMWHTRINNALDLYDVSYVKNLTEFDAALQHDEYDVASIDMVLERTGESGGDEDGREALDLLRNKHRAIGKVVFSVHMGDPMDKIEAQHLGADYVIEKQGVGSDEVYVQAVLDAARLNFFRRVLSHLRDKGRRMEEFAEGRLGELSDEQERRLYAEALDALMASFLEGEEDSVLMNLLKKRGALPKFDSPRYISLPFHGKLAELLGYVHVTPEQLSQILEVDTDIAERLVEGKEELLLGERERRNAYRLASILDFVMRLANDEPGLMWRFWVPRHLYTKNKNIPPWDSDGLRDYLITNGATGLEKALRWIRSY